MPVLRLALAQVNPTVGDLDGNARLVRDRAREAADDGAHLVAFPEMVLTGYPVEDLALRSAFVDASRRALTELAADLERDGLGDLPVVVGYLDRADADSDGRADPDVTGRPRGNPQNCAAVLHRGAVVARYAKHHLPNYGVFDERRIFVPGDTQTVVRVGGETGVDVALAICEDLWQDGGPVATISRRHPGLLLVINASPYERDKDDVRLDLVTRRSREAGCPLAYVNAVGGQDELVFDGDSVVVDGDRTLTRAAQFQELLLTVDIDLPSATSQPDAVLPGSLRRVAPREPRPEPVIAQRLPDEEEVYEALVTGLRDYARKNGFRQVVLGLSGGIDSALVATLAVDALGPGGVIAVSMPSSYSSQHSQDDADDLAQRAGLDYRVVPIAPLVDSFLAALPLRDLAEENLQSRVRGVVLMGISNSEGPLVLATGNKSELAVGYSTIYGDSVGGFAPLKDVPKTMVWRLARWRNAHAEKAGQAAPIPENSINKPPSAELRPGQLDSDSLPDYETLDAILDEYVEGDAGRAELIAAGFDPAVVDTVVALVDRAEWKRRQFAPGPKISLKAFGRDRRLPITSRWREHQV